MTVCGVAGNVTMSPLAEPEPLPPCAEDARVTVRFRCSEGHERERVVCDVHAAVLYAQAPFAETLWLACSESTGVDSPLTPLDPEGAS